MIKTNKKYLTKKKIIIFLILILFVSGLLLALEKMHIINLYSRTNSNVPLQPESFINYGHPTEEEQNAGDVQKDKIVANEGGHSNNDNETGQTVNVIITDVGQYDDIIEVRAFIPNYYQDGSCRITFTKDTQKVEKTTPAYRDVSTTICTNPLFPRSEFTSSGNWQVTVTYTAEGVYGTSNSQNVTIN